MSVSGKRVLLPALGFVLVAALVLSTLPGGHVYAATGQITSRSLTLQSNGSDSNGDGIPDGGSMPSANVNHFFQFTLPAVGNPSVGSMLFQYCTTASGTCTMPAGLVTTAATYGADSGATGFTIVNTTNGQPYITRTAATINANTAVSYHLDDITNPDGTSCSSNNCTFFVRISTYNTTNPLSGSPTPIDAGTVAASTSTQIVLQGTMPESLIFCTGRSVSTNGGGIPDCSTATAGNVSFDRLFSPTEPAYATSQMAASTNALSGYTITLSGPTLTDGSYTIPAIGTTPTTSASTVGISKFGVNLVHDTETDSLAGAEVLNPLSASVNPAPNGVFLMGKPTANFGTDGSYTFDDTANNLVAKSDNGTGTSAPTDSQIFTTTYMVNVAGHQVAGTYTTTLTYICTPTF